MSFSLSQDTETSWSS